MKNNPLAQKKRSRHWYLANKEKHAAQRSAWVKKHPRLKEKIGWRSHLKRRYGITPEQWEKLYKQQAGRCAICLKRPGKRRLSTDHCHKTAKVRGLLCQGCNLFLGFLETKIELFPKAWRYLFE